MTEEKYNTKDKRHIDKKNQEYIAEGNRMTEEIELTTEVLNCDYFNRNRGFNCYKGKNCTEAPDCYYRQLTRLEQENKELKIYIESNKQQVEEAEMLVMDNDRLQQEVENLKDVIYYDVERYRSALEEIREIIIADCKRCTAECDCDNDCTRYMIKNKISEALK